MSFEKPIKEGENHSGRRQAGTEYMCVRCGNMVKPSEPIVIWDMLRIPDSEFEAQLSPIAVLAAQTNPRERKPAGYYIIDMVLHTHCAVYLGGHLIKDGLSDNTVSATIRNVKEK